MPGDEMEITAGVGAFSKAALPTITIEGTPEKLTDDGAAHRTVRASGSLGKHTIQVSIKYTDQEGIERTIPKTIEYTVGQSAASIALDKMNVLYIGVDNPVSISATGGGTEKIDASITTGKLTDMGGGHYIARVNTFTDECYITVSVGGRQAGKSKFRVRTIPQSQAYVGGQPSGASVAAGAFGAQGGVGAGIKDFPFELQYAVQSFTFTIDTDEGDIVPVSVIGKDFTPAVRSAMKSHLKAGRLVTIDDIRVKGPDGRTTPAPSLIYYIK
jgi:gliding motility-associated protein GldM